LRVSVIIPLYKDLQALKIVLQALQRQTYKNFEVIIAEDDDSLETPLFLKNYSDLEIVHISQPDTGRNKVIIQNKAICKARGEYLIFIDGDIVPFEHFIEYSLKLAKPKHILSGRRVNLNESLTQKIKNSELDIQDIEKNYLSFLLQNRNDRHARVEQGIQLSPEGFLYKYFLSKRKRNTEILGCNFSCFKEDMLSINGFDEEYHPLATLADDTDLSWRFKGMGYTLVSSKNIANCFHLWHKTGTSNIAFDVDRDIALFQKNQESKQYVCKNGLDKYCENVHA
jgi:glycosyltransferase involved in cell wall biosynthesis